MIKINEVTFSYKKDKVILNNITTSIKSKNIIGVLGHNGAGKTTLFKLITGLLNKDLGEILINDSPPNVNKVKKCTLSYMPEKGGLYGHLTVFQNMKFRAQIIGVKKEEIHLKCESLLKRVNLFDKRNEKIETLSNGMQKRLSLAAACINMPKILLLDEPTNGIDQESLKIMCDMLLEMKEHGSTILISTHDFQTVSKVCDNLIIINNGEIVYDDKNIPINELEDLYLNLTKDKKL